MSILRRGAFNAEKEDHGPLIMNVIKNTVPFRGVPSPCPADTASFHSCDTDQTRLHHTARNHPTPPHATPPRPAAHRTATPCHATSRHATPHRTALHHTTHQHHGTTRHATPRRAITYYMTQTPDHTARNHTEPHRTTLSQTAPHSTRPKHSTLNRTVSQHNQTIPAARCSVKHDCARKATPASHPGKPSDAHPSPRILRPLIPKHTLPGVTNPLVFFKRNVSFFFPSKPHFFDEGQYTKSLLWIATRGFGT